MHYLRYFIALLAIFHVLPASAQVRLIYEVDGKRLLINSLANGVPCHLENGVTKAIPSGGHLHLERAADWSDLDFGFHVRYRVRAKRPDEIRTLGDSTHLVGFTFVPEGQQSLRVPLGFYVVAWEVDGELRHLQVRPASFLQNAMPADLRIELRPGEENGVFRFYLFDPNGRSLAGERNRAGELRHFRDALDAGDRARLKTWCADHASRVALNTELLRQLIRFGDVDILRAVLAGKTKLNNFESTADTPLQVAAQMGNLAAVEVLLQAGAKVNTKPLSALYFAAQQGASDVVERLLAAGAKTYPRDDSVFSSIGAALDNGDLGMATKLLEADPVRPLPTQFNIWLAQAVERSRNNVVEYLLTAGADPKGVTSGGTPLLIFACERGNIDLARRFLAAGADVNAHTSRGYTPLMAAASRGHESIMEMLLAAGADAAAADDAHWTAAAYVAAMAPPEVRLRVVQRLFAAKPLAEREKLFVLRAGLAIGGGREVVEWLVQEAGVKLDPKDGLLERLLCRAIQLGAVNVCRQAVALGVSPGKKLEANWTFAALARYYDMDEVLSDMAAGGHRVSTAYPPFVKDPIQMIYAPTALLPASLLRESGPLEAEVELMIAPDGSVRFPRVRRATSEAFTAFALHHVAGIRFNPATTSGGWRHVILPLSFDREQVADKLIDDRDRVDLAPVFKTTTTKPVAPKSISGPLRAVWVVFTVSETGEVLAPRVLGSTHPEAGGEALAAVAQWRYEPAQKEGKAVSCRRQELVLLPEGRPISTTELEAAVRDDTGEILMPYVKKIQWTNYPDALKQRRTTGIAVMRFTITRDGKIKNLQTLAATDEALAASVGEYIETWRFEAARQAGQKIDVDVIRAFTYSP